MNTEHKIKESTEEIIIPRKPGRPRKINEELQDTPEKTTRKKTSAGKVGSKKDNDVQLNGETHSDSAVYTGNSKSDPLTEAQSADNPEVETTEESAAVINKVNAPYSTKRAKLKKKRHHSGKHRVKPIKHKRRKTVNSHAGKRSHK